MSTFVSAASVEQALQAISDGARPVAGGTDLVVGARQGKAPLPASIVAIHEVEELRGIGDRPDGGLHVRALVTHDELERSPAIRARWPALADAAALVGSPATRCVGTIGGNLANGSPAMEVGSPLLVYEAVVELASRKRRDLPIAEFLQAPAETACRPDELVVGVVLPPLPEGLVGSAYLRLEFRRSMEIAVVGAAALLALDGDGAIAESRIALTAVAPTCVRAPEAEAALAGQEPSGDALRTAAAAAALQARPIDDVRATAAYRSAMVPVVVRRALELALARARGEEGT